MRDVSLFTKINWANTVSKKANHRSINVAEQMIGLSKTAIDRFVQILSGVSNNDRTSCVEQANTVTAAVLTLPVWRIDSHQGFYGVAFGRRGELGASLWSFVNVNNHKVLSLVP